MARLPTLVLATLIAGGALAHAGKEQTTPPDGATLAEGPARIELRFDAPMRLTLVRLTDAAGTEAPLAPARALTPVTEFVATPPTLAPGDYTVEWRGLATDGHPMDGAFRFTVR